jgi:hypothetical protein
MFFFIFQRTSTEESLITWQSHPITVEKTNTKFKLKTFQLQMRNSYTLILFQDLSNSIAEHYIFICEKIYQ